jgi:hypothetical protein
MLQYSRTSSSSRILTSAAKIISVEANARAAKCIGKKLVNLFSIMKINLVTVDLQKISL